MGELTELPTVYDPKSVEPEVRAFWADGGYFHAEPADPRETYTIVIPPPNVTGALHGGHALNNTLQDILIRWRRMQGYNTLWMPGTDHAGIATQAVVEKRIFETEKKSRHDLGREELVKRIWDWKEQYGNRIIEQLKLMGCSCDWERTRFTLDDICARAVRETFFRLFKDGLIVRGKRLVNWDTHLQTAVADDEVYHETVKGHFYHFKYPVIDPQPGEPEFVHIATTRPETMLGDTAVAVHPEPDKALDKREAALKEQLREEADKDREAIQTQIEQVAERRRTHLPTLLKLRDMARDGRQVRLPLVCRPIPLIADEWADPMLGSGCVKITPAHDPNDYEVGQRHGLPMNNVMTPDGRIADLSSHTCKPEVTKTLEGLKFATDGRKAVVAEMDVRGLVELIEDRDIDVGHSDRSKTAIEPYLSDQWFVRMGDLTADEVNAMQSEHMRAYAKEPRASARAVSPPGRTPPPTSEPASSANDAFTSDRSTARAEARGSLCSGSSATHPGLAQLAMDHVCEKEHASEEERKACGKVHFFPARYAKTYLDWLGEKRDWCISRQLWWGHRIPVWYLLWEGPVAFGPTDSQLVKLELPFLTRSENQHVVTQVVRERADGRIFFAICVEPGHTRIEEQLQTHGAELDPDVLDTWFSSALWPHSTLGWPENTPELQHYYPGSVLSTAREIITLWVARMVITGLYNLGKVPFHDVYIHAVIQDAQGRPFKKTLGNGFDPVDIIEFYGADALRFTMASSATETQDIRMPMKKVKTDDGRELQTSERFELGRNFSNKLWNAARFAFMTLKEPRASARAVSPPEGTPPSASEPTSTGVEAFAGDPSTARAEARGSLEVSLDLPSLPIEDRWILSKTSDAAVEVQEALAGFQFSRAVTIARDFFWDSVCDWYLELVKLRVRENCQADEARIVLAFVLDQSLRLLHPFIPFITERLWQQLRAIAADRRVLSMRVTARAEARGSLAPALLVAPYPPRQGWPEFVNPRAEAVFSDLQTATRAVREVRQTQNVPPKQTVDITIKVPADRVESMQREAHVIEELANVGKIVIDPNASASKNAATLVIGDMQIFVHDVIDPAAERQRLDKELAGLDKQISGLSGKLSNDGFVKNAPAEVVATERQRLSDLQAKREQILQTLSTL